LTTLNPLDRIQQHAREWRVIHEVPFETESSLIAFGKRDHMSVVLKVARQAGDEWRSGEILDAFDGQGVARVYEQAPGCVLLERLRPGYSLANLTLKRRDEAATDILAEVIQQMSARSSSMSPLGLPPACATVQDWAKAFARYIATGDDQIPSDLVAAGQHVYLNLCASQRRPILLHGDLQHYNVLFDSDRGWLAIDPKGVIGEIECEVGAFLRNPFERPELFVSRSTIARRLKQLAKKLNLDYERALAWSFAQAVLSAIWSIEDGFAVHPTDPVLRLAETIKPMLGRSVV
jgi:streptomycin 6-kinase